MNDDTTERQQSPGRTFGIIAFGDTADEIELAALDEAREFFGASRQLEIISAYEASPATIPSFIERANGKKYYASVTVRTVEP